MSGYDLMKVKVSSGKVVEDLKAAAEPSPAQHPGLHSSSSNSSSNRSSTKNKYEGWIQFCGHRCKNTGSCLLLGTSRRGKQVSCVTACFFVQSLCRTITAAAAKLRCQSGRRQEKSDSLLFKDGSLTLVLGPAPLEQVSRLTHCSSALWICHWRPSLCRPCRKRRRLSRWCCWRGHKETPTLQRARQRSRIQNRELARHQPPCF